jgi:hypothetical protein
MGNFNGRDVTRTDHTTTRARTHTHTHTHDTRFCLRTRAVVQVQLCQRLSHAGECTIWNGRKWVVLEEEKGKKREKTYEESR